MREKLIELIMDLPITRLTYEEMEKYSGNVADYLIANDVVPVVRCKDCMWARPKDHRDPVETPREFICQCAKHHYIPGPWGARTAVNADDFCSYGERKDNG